MGPGVCVFEEEETSIGPGSWVADAIVSFVVGVGDIEHKFL
jgi:hypothetical protein